MCGCVCVCCMSVFLSLKSERKEKREDYSERKKERGLLRAREGTVCAKKNLPLPFNETERNGPFNETERAVHDPFFIRSRSVRIFRPF